MDIIRARVHDSAAVAPAAGDDETTFFGLTRACETGVCFRHFFVLLSSFLFLYARVLERSGAVCYNWEGEGER